MRPAEFSPLPVRRRISAAHWLSLGLVWLTFAASGIVFTEPAPYDALMLGLVFALPLVGLVRLPPSLLLYLALWLLIAAAGFAASSQAARLDVAATHMAVSLYLFLSSVLVAAFIAVDPERHARLIFAGYAFAAVLAAGAGVVGYFSLAPGAAELFTLYERARGTFKDPNVLGPFLIPILLYAVHRLVAGGIRQTLLWAGVFVLVLFGLLLTFSRGAWFNALLALTAYAYLALIMAPSNRWRLKLILMSVFGLGAAAAVIAASLQISAIAELLGSRASLSLEYDVGPEGRFGGQRRAFDILLQHPLGIGALEFSHLYHREDAHNVYLSMFLNAGWLGGLGYLALVLATLALGARHVVARGRASGVMIVALASFAGLAAEGLVVDTDHWRHFYVLMGVIWGLSAAPRKPPSPACAAGP